MRGKRQEFIGEVHFRTAKALLFQDHFWEAPEWMPISQLKNLSDPETPEETHISASAWICGAKGITEFEQRDNLEEEDEEDLEEQWHEAMMRIREKTDG